LEKRQQLEPLDGEAPATVDEHGGPADVDVLAGPALGRRLDAPDEVGRAVVEELEGALGEDHAEAIGGVRGILLEHADVARRVAALQQIGQVEPGRAAADDRDLERHPSLRWTVLSPSLWHHVEFSTSKSSPRALRMD